MQLALLALFLGVLIGAGVASIFLVALRARDRVRLESSVELPDGITAVLEGMDDAAAVVDTSLHLVATSHAAAGSGCTRGEPSTTPSCARWCAPRARPASRAPTRCASGEGACPPSRGSSPRGRAC